jgi:hypothetical protein
LFSLPSNKPAWIQVAESYEGLREVGYNRGITVDSMNRNCGNKPGSSWCAAFVYWCLDKAHIKYDNKKSGLARSLINKNSISAWDVINGKKKVLCGMAGIFQKGKTIFGHAIFIDEDWKSISGKTIEGNTNKAGSSDGDGVYEKTRKIEPYNYFRLIKFTAFNYG